MKFFFFLVIIVLAGRTPIHALNIHRFEVRRTSHTRLCTTKTMLTVNGEFPGPTIYTRRGELVIVDVINRADQNITIHWHGVKMLRYPWSDGTDSVTQCPIRPGQRFRQRVVLSDEEGTLFWHAHLEWTRATVYGAIIILPPIGETYPFPKPDAEVPILLGEWWNGDVLEVYKDMLARGREATICDAFLMNGQPGDLYPCSREDTLKLKVESGKRYLIRLINSMLNYIVYIKIGNHNMTVVGADATYTKPLITDHVSLSPGQTIDFLLEANQAPSHYYMAGRVYARGGDYVPTTAIVEYVGSNYTPPPSPMLPTFPEFDGWAQSSDFTNRLRSLASQEHPIDVPMNITENLFFVVAMNLWPCLDIACKETERLLGSVNNVSMIMPGTDILQAYYRGMNGVFTTDFAGKPPPKAFDFMGEMPWNRSRPHFGTAVYMLEYGSEVEIVLQATAFYAVDHPMHLHGYSFYVLGSGFGNFDPTRDRPTLNLVDPPLMNTIAVPREGWSVIRFKANNPGVWFFHCHFERHESWGMKMVFIVRNGEAPDQKMLPPPPDMPRCDIPPQELLLRI